MKRAKKVLDPNAEGTGADGAADQNGKMGLLSALQAERKARQKLEIELAKVSGAVEGLKAGQQQPKTPDAPKPRFSRAQLRASVEQGAITQDQADSIWDQQHEEEILAKASSDANAKVSASVKVGKIQGQIDAYVESHPELVVDGSDLRKKGRARVQTTWSKNSTKIPRQRRHPAQGDPQCARRASQPDRPPRRAGNP
jgi:hypothetical protein